MDYTHTIDSTFTPQNAKNGNKHNHFEETISNLERFIQSEISDKTDTASTIIDYIYADLADHDTHSAIQSLADEMLSSASRTIIFGTGASTLNAKIFLNFSEDDNQNVICLDSIDPKTIEHTFNSVDPKNTNFLFISKSGTTLETMAHVAAFSHFMARNNMPLEEAKITIVTDPHDNPLRNWGTLCKAKILDHPVSIGGRYATLSVVGLLPAALVHLDILKIVEGAKNALQLALSGEDKSAINGAAFLYANLQNNFDQTVLFSYVDQLQGLQQWHRQMWAESLGKNGKGLTPIESLGTLDQHSQLQLYLDGPKNKTFSFIEIDRSGQGENLACDTAPLKEHFAYLHNKAIGDVVMAELQATKEVLVDAAIPVRSFSIDSLNEKMLGELIIHVILETICVAHLLGIDPFDQPAVESGKKIAKQKLEALT